MKFLILFFIFGAASCFPQDPCNPNEDLVKCFKYAPQIEPYLETEQEVERSCKGLTCILEFYKRCPEIDPKNYVEKAPLERHWRALCNPQSKKEFRKKYFDNVKCLSKQQRTFDCLFAEDSCENVIQAFQCNKHEIAEMCGQDAVDVYATLDTRFELRGCVRPQ